MTIDVFISYARIDQDAANHVATLLKKSGLEVWWDALLIPGEVFDERIQEVLAESKVIVGILSPASLLSDWVRWELSQAITNGLHVVPILVGGVHPEDLPPPISLVHALSLPNIEEATLKATAEHVAKAVSAVDRRKTRHSTRDKDALRRLGQAASETARRACEIKRQNNRPLLGNNSQNQSEGLPYSASSNFSSILRKHKLSLAITSPDTGHLYLIGCAPDGSLCINISYFEGSRGLCLCGDGLLLASRTNLIKFENILREGQIYGGRFSHCFVARQSHLIGDLAPHDILVDNGDIHFVSSRYSCVATPSPRHSFRLTWKPGFITEVVAEDRCHLNGLVANGGRLAYATAFAPTNSIDGWRNEVQGGGIVLDIPSGKIVCSGLTMPHSPRLHQGQLWLLNSGHGELGIVNKTLQGNYKYESKTSLPGFTRGLTFSGELAFVGLSRPRYEDYKSKEGETDDTSWTGVAVINSLSGEHLAYLQFKDGAREIYDVIALDGVACAMSLEPNSEEASGLVTIE